MAPPSLALEFRAGARDRTQTRPVADARINAAIAILLALLHMALALTANLDKSPTFDEPTHLTAGYSYWLRNDFRLDPENGNLMARWAALPLLLSHPRFPAFDAPVPGRAHAPAGNINSKFLYGPGNNADEMMLSARLMMSIFSGALCLLIFVCAKQLFGLAGGFIAEIIALFDPNLLAHAALVTPDVAAAFFFTAAVWTTWRLLHVVSFRTLLFSCLSVSGLFLTKMSAPLFVVMAGILGLLHVCSPAAMEIRFPAFNRTIVMRVQKMAALALLGIVLATSIFISIWAAYSFRFSAVANEPGAQEMWKARWASILEEPDRLEKMIGLARDHRILPDAYLYGLVYVHAHAQTRPAFLDNRWSDVGFRSFFPRAFLYKTPLPIFGLILMASAAAILRRRPDVRRNARAVFARVFRDCLKLAPFLVLLTVYSAFALITKLNIGHRHLLPLYPAVFILCGAVGYFLIDCRPRFVAILVALLIGWQLTESFFIRPHYLAYFNEAAGGPTQGYKHLVDSSLDWGQDLPALKSWLDQHGKELAGQPVYLAYFGTADPRYYQIAAKLLPETGREKKLSALQPGLYCVSATVLQHVYALERGKWGRPYEIAYQRALAQVGAGESVPDALQSRRVGIFQRLRFARLCAYLRHREPIANAGYSILLYRLTAEDLEQALYGAPAELAPAIEVAAR